jgi:hypothetical protein
LRFGFGWVGGDSDAGAIKAKHNAKSEFEWSLIGMMMMDFD